MILDLLKEDFYKMYERKKKLKLDFIGLTGAGLQMEECSLKILLRCENNNEIFTKLIAKMRKYHTNTNECPPWLKNSKFKLAKIKE